jgi:hypothetical protein
VVGRDGADGGGAGDNEEKKESMSQTNLTSHEAANPDAGQRVLHETYSPIDFPEDFGHENGKYINICCVCHRTFVGHKRRVVCKDHANV